MRLELTGRHLDITPGIRGVIDRKLAKLERMLNDSAVSAQVVLTREKAGSRADVTLHARGEKFLHGNGRGVNTTVAMGEAVDKLVQQAHKIKSKWQERKRRTVRPRVEAQAPEPLAATGTTSSRKRRAAVQMPQVLRASRQSIRTMTVKAAAASIDRGPGAVIFRDVETARIAVLYRAPGGDLTLIETEA